jgi:hypothetical protein
VDAVAADGLAAAAALLAVDREEFSLRGHSTNILRFSVASNCPIDFATLPCGVQQTGKRGRM